MKMQDIIYISISFLAFAGWYQLMRMQNAQNERAIQPLGWLNVFLQNLSINQLSIYE